MTEPFCIYLAGNIRKGKEDEKEAVWTEVEMDLLREHLAPVRALFLNPATRSDDLSDQVSVFGRDMFQVYSSHCVIVDARGKRGLGVGAEMMFAKMNRIPVISWLPPDTHYHRKHLHYMGQDVHQWVHPFVVSLSDYLAPSLEAAAKWIREKLHTKEEEVKGPEVIQGAMQHYLSTQLHRDHSMQSLVSQHAHFNTILEGLGALGAVSK